MQDGVWALEGPLFFHSVGLDFGLRPKAVFEGKDILCHAN